MLGRCLCCGLGALLLLLPAGDARAATTEDTPARPPLTASPSETPQAYYAECRRLLARENARDVQTIDFARFRRGYFEALRAGVAKEPDRELESQLRAAFSGNDWNEVLRAADAVLELDGTRIRAHLMKSMAQERLGRDNSFQLSLGLELVKSILASGDGRSPETAFHVYFTREEYAVLEALGLRMKSQSLMQAGERSYDHLTAVDREGGTTELYFDVTEHMAALADLFAD